MTNLEDINLDIEAMANNIYIGPQAQILERLETFNRRYSRYNIKPIGITNKFYWKPGTYPILKELINKVQFLDKKCSSAVNLFDKMANRAWNLRNLKQDIAGIESLLFSRRRENVVFRNNTEDIKETWLIIKQHILNQLDNATNFNNDVVNVTITESNMFEHDYLLNITFELSNYNIKYQDHGEDIAEIEYPATNKIIFEIKLSSLLNALLANNNEFSNLKRNLLHIRTGGQTISDYELFHPFISRHGTSNNDIPGYRYICIGNMATEIDACITSLDIGFLDYYIFRMLTHFDTQTHPLNHINSTYYGTQKPMLDDEWTNRRGRRESSECNNILFNDNDEIEIRYKDYCDKYCVVKDNCLAYEQTDELGEPKFQEVKETLAEESLAAADISMTEMERATLEATIINRR